MSRSAFRLLALNFVVAATTGLVAHSVMADVKTQKPERQEAVVLKDDGQVETVAKPAPKADSAKPDFTGAPEASWIWEASNPEGCFVKTEFETDAKSAILAASCDNIMEIAINGKKVVTNSEWQAPSVIDVTAHLKAGKNEIVAKVDNEGGGGARGFVLKLAIVKKDGSKQFVVTNDTWQAAKAKDFANASKAKALFPYGKGPWGNILENPGEGGGGGSLKGKVPAGVFQVQDGFSVELLYTVPKGEQGSWVNLGVDHKGRLIASDQGNQGLYRITPAAIGSGDETKVEALDVKIDGKPVSGAQGLLHAFGSLYVCCNGGPGSGLYRCTDTDGNDTYDKVERIKAFQGGGEHGPHGLRLSPDGKHVVVIAGNHTLPPYSQARTPEPQKMGGARTEPIRSTLPEGVSSRLQTNWDEDLLLKRQWDANGHAAGILAPGGWIAQTDPEGKHWEMISAGYRNPFDMAFTPEGELFAYDADMEWDMGSPWYRPTRLVHAVSGSEFGWRSGTGKWPTGYHDSLPQVVDIGPGSPVGVTAGTGAKFPAKYQKAIYLCDWTFGTIFAVHLTPNGASYVGTKEPFVGRAPLPLTDAVIGNDGAMYFTIGGRGAQSALYRVTYTGSESTAPVAVTKDTGTELRALRRKIEEHHVAGRSSAENVKFLWPHLSHSDRFIRYAARVALEFQDLKLWHDALINETNPEALMTGTVALAHVGEPSSRDAITTALAKIDWKKLDEAQRIELLRSYQLVFIRLGAPDQALATTVLKQIDAAFPTKSNAVDRELANVLVFLNSPTIINKCLAIMNPKEESADTNGLSAAAEVLARNQGYGGTVAKVLSNQVNLQQMHYAFALRNMRFGWTLEQRQQYFGWYNEAAKRSGGNSYQKFLINMKNEALANASDKEKKALEGLINVAPVKEAELPKPLGPGKEAGYTIDEVLVLIGTGLKNRNFEAGARAYKASRCMSCHRFDGEGGSTGPDLTNVAGRFTQRDLLESIIDPSKVISDQYKASVIELKSGKVLTGRVLSEVNGKLSVLADPVDHTKIVELAKSEIEELAPSPISLMPKDLLKPLGKEEILDLLAYLLSRGNPNDAAFGK